MTSADVLALYVGVTEEEVRGDAMNLGNVLMM